MQANLASNVTIVILINTHEKTWTIIHNIQQNSVLQFFLCSPSRLFLFKVIFWYWIIACLKLSMNVHPPFCRGCWWVWSALLATTIQMMPFLMSLPYMDWPHLYQMLHWMETVLTVHGSTQQRYRHWNIAWKIYSTKFTATMPFLKW